MTHTPAPTALKAKHRALWALGDYPDVAATVIPDLGQALVEACTVSEGDRVLDVAAGSGNASVPAALAGAEVTASDLTPELLEAGRARAEADGVSLTWEVGDAEALPYPDASFDVVMSCVGVMFAPFHRVAAGELLRVARPGARIGLLSWTPDGFIGRMFATMKPYAPPPPEGAQPPPLWGDETHVRELLGEGVADLSAVRRTVTVDGFATPEAFRDYFKACYGPTIATYRGLDQDRAAALDEDLATLARGFDEGGGVMRWEYLLVTTRRA
ncbi:class I SAM-dependent methyltransferase [Nocardioides marmotae]|uniref:Methyltransferase domain-containing protein n=1 Tax=Nocardioides marmotae TaxID=2663857 RepID=A0A6I3JFV4_9ACTN|nr:class I SAM-dependent methyltransferase [Nocardioides marmotae]MCR6033364.1 methyltransferase domain-containing protein [Gordonia jinghuaiqii]MBC9734121.1 class I SAM-dependent methyltransferase [Nocardioides marmotae]MTB85224.1 methyltransferase domain-containing protein [Nocardioides marmotae]MTB97021.1 methyltransferase domain-containing protein [Nocardioides marmotae]QKE00600.1 class I SAM-dependent methyltransferase [Nocardioides marmotae]